MKKLGWSRLDVILVSGDAYIDSPYIGVAIIARVLLSAGYRVGVISQPDIHSGEDICRLGEPGLFWGVSGGNIDSMVANYTATRKRRKKDDFTPGGLNTRRPDRAAVVYSHLIRRHFKNTCPIVLGGIEASLRRISHYDFWSDSVRRSILFDAKADYLLYGMADQTVLDLAATIKTGGAPGNVRGLCYIASAPVEGYLELPSHGSVSRSHSDFISMFRTFYEETDPVTARGLCQLQDTRYLVQSPPPPLLSQKDLDAVHELPYTYQVHPHDKGSGDVRALDTIDFSIATHRGCYGECNFCAIGVHQGRTVQWRSSHSIVSEAKRFSTRPDFKGIIQDVGGATANMYGFECDKKLEKGICRNRRCLFPEICPNLPVTHRPQTLLLNQLRSIGKVRKVFVRSGLRYDLLNTDKSSGLGYLKNLATHHVSGQLKVAPEHSDPDILKLMGKQSITHLLSFKREFDRLSRECGKRQFLTYYFIAAYPGCRDTHMAALKKFVTNELKMTPEQVQIFTPTPSTWASLMYYTGTNPFTGQSLFVEKDALKKEGQKRILTAKRHPGKRRIFKKRSPGPGPTRVKKEKCLK
jgi:uncharacterized radical SAM protein YgiQ